MQKEITVNCQDGTLLQATVFHPSTATKGAIMLAPATGIKRGFYNRFAANLAEQGYGVITYDNNGIGDSLKGKLKDCKASLRSWGEVDMPAVLRKLQELFPQTNYHLIGHSAGGQLVGLMPNAKEFTSMLNFACSSGNLSNMPFPFSIQAKIFMNVFIPLNNLLFGYANSQWVGMGEPLPKNVAQQWTKWCNGAGYVETDFNTISKHWYHELSFPSLWINAADDSIANNTNVDDMTRVFSKLPIKRLILNPTEHNAKEIGHMKFFSSKNKQLWDIAVDWLSQSATAEYSSFK